MLELDGLPNHALHAARDGADQPDLPGEARLHVPSVDVNVRIWCRRPGHGDPPPISATPIVRVRPGQPSPAGSFRPGFTAGAATLLSSAIARSAPPGPPGCGPPAGPAGPLQSGSQPPTPPSSTRATVAPNQRQPAGQVEQRRRGHASLQMGIRTRVRLGVGVQ